MRTKKNHCYCFNCNFIAAIMALTIQVYYTKKIIILEEGSQLLSALPLILENNFAQKKYNLPAQTAYTFWFDIM